MEDQEIIDVVKLQELIMAKTGLSRPAAMEQINIFMEDFLEHLNNG